MSEINTVSATTKLARSIIRQTIKDLAKLHGNDFDSAKEYIHSNRFAGDCLSAGYPEELRDTLKELVVVSGTERQYLTKEVLVILRETWE